MPLVPLLGGNYQGRSTQAASRRLCVNLYPERNPEEGQPLTPVTYYQTPGLLTVGTSPTVEGMRQSYRASNGALYAVVGPNVYSVSSTFAWTLLGSITDAATPVVFSDNGLTIVIVDGSSTGYAIDMATNAFGPITDPSFMGALWATQQDGFFIFNNPGTNQFYLSLSNVTYAMMTGVSGRILSSSIASGGSGYVAGSYTNVPLTGGTGSGATANITVSGGGVVTVVTVVNPGAGYSLNDTLSASNTNLGGSGSGFAYAVDEVATAFDPLDIASKSSFADPIAAVAAIHGVLWLIGELTSEVWAPSGAADFYFQRITGAVVQHGCAAPYSVAQQDVSLFWLSQNAQGHAIVVRAQDTSIVRISTNAIEADIQTYATISDAIGFCHQVEGHSFYILTFPSADITWAYDLSTGQWHRRVSIDGNGVQHRWRANCFAFAFGLNLVGDYQNGRFYSLDSSFFTDAGVAIPRIVTFPHVADGGRRLFYSQFQAKMEVGAIVDTPIADAPKVGLRWSDDAGVTFGNAVMQSLGASGQYLTSPQWQRLGMARDRIFEMSWSADASVAIAGAWLNFREAAT
jgi:hypothetical protein